MGTDGASNRKTVRRVLAIGMAVLWCRTPAAGQDTLAVALPELQVTATRRLGVQANMPLSTVTVRRSEFERESAPGVTLEQTLGTIPGLYVSDRNYSAVGERIMIRGMGSRAAFGVRGVQIVLDGIPLTLPDGQSVAEIVDPSMITSTELMRGPASAFWGNGSGGVLMLSTTLPPGIRASRVRIQGGSLGLVQILGETRVALGRHSVRAWVSEVSRQGFREHSTDRFTRAGLLSTLVLGRGTTVNATATAAFQEAEHPGSLTEREYESDPRQAAVLYVNQDARKESGQFQVGLNLLRSTGPGLLSVATHWTARSLTNPLPFAYIELNRSAGGIDVSYEHAAGILSWAIAGDARFQRDDRKNWNTVSGERGDRQDLDQVETVTSGSARAIGHYALTNSLSLSAGLRWDRVGFETRDVFLENGDQSGRRSFQSVTPMVGLAYSISGTTAYVDYGSAFDTPTTTELVNRPDLSGGFNPDLDAEKTSGIEAGVRGTADEGRLYFDLALYRFSVRDRLVPFQTEEGGDRVFYKNAGSAIHRGVETALVWHLVPGAQVEIGATVARFTFSRDEFAGNHLPGLPEKMIYFAVGVSPGSYRARLEIRRTAACFADDANSVTVDGYSLINARAQHEGLSMGAALIRPFVSADNLAGRRYVSSVTINSSSGRYFDPGSGRVLRAGVNVLF